MEFIKAHGRKLVTETGKEILLKGFGLGGWLLPEGYMWKFFHQIERPRRMENLIKELCGEEYEKSFWKLYRDRYITKEDIDLIASFGFNSVRLPINSRNLFEKNPSGLFFIEDVITRIDRIISYCKKKNVYVILDMHGAPGGQTGANIDDSENDKPELFMNPVNHAHCIQMWKMLAIRYAEEPCVAGFDLLNEPLPEYFKEFNQQLLPLYRDIVREIRKFDRKHLIILEGAHWDTDFSIFDPLSEAEFDDNYMLQFHKYWNVPDLESIKRFLGYGDKLNVPLFMGEGGENNNDWYSGAFSMLRKANISYNFWSYKKMDNMNSPITFPRPKHWDRIVNHIDGKITLTREEAVEIFDYFLDCISHGTVNHKVIGSVERLAPITIPAEFYEDYSVNEERIPGADIRMEEKVTIQFMNDQNRTGIPDYSGRGGKMQSMEDNLCILLHKNDWVTYEFNVLETQEFNIKINAKSLSSEPCVISISIDGNNALKCSLLSEWQDAEAGKMKIKQGKHYLKLFAEDNVLVHTVSI